MRSLFGDCDEIRDALLASRPHPGLHNDKSSRFLERQMPKLLALNSENARKDGVDLPGGGDANCCSKSPIRFLRLMLGNDMARQNVSNLNGRHRSGVGDVGPPGCQLSHGKGNKNLAGNEPSPYGSFHYEPKDPARQMRNPKNKLSSHQRDFDKEAT